MRNKNYYINLNDREYLDVLSSLMNKRNKLIQSGKYTDGIDEVIMKIKKAMQGKKVLLVDADPQGDLTTCLGWQDTDNLPIALPDKMVEVMQDKCKEPMKGILHHKEGVDLIPSNSDLFDFEISLVTAMNREAILRNYLNEVKHNYDYIIIDCSPSLGMMTLNALSAADSVIIPVQAHY